MRFIELIVSASSEPFVWSIDAGVDVEGVFGFVAVAKVILSPLQVFNAFWAGVMPELRSPQGR